MRRNSSAPTLALGLIVMTLVGQCYGQLKVEFYNGKCGNANVEDEILKIVTDAYVKDSSLLAAMLRMQFHDCFVKGCDASILLDGANTEKTAGPNGSVRGYEFIDIVKEAMENICPGVVSCADIIIIVTRITVSLAHGIWYEVETGRRDGLNSTAADAMTSLPPPDIPIPQAVAMFVAKKLSIEDFVLLLGGHTVGNAHCGNFQGRLYNYRGTGRSDPSISPSLLPVLKTICPQNGPGTNYTSLDQMTPEILDNGFYKAVMQRKGILQVDQDLGFDPLTKNIVARYAANSGSFGVGFANALINLGRVDVLTGTQGQIRKSCRYVNSY